MSRTDSVQAVVHVNSFKSHYESQGSFIDSAEPLIRVWPTGLTSHSYWFGYIRIMNLD